MKFTDEWMDRKQLSQKNKCHIFFHLQMLVLDLQICCFTGNVYRSNRQWKVERMQQYKRVRGNNGTRSGMKMGRQQRNDYMEITNAEDLLNNLIETHCCRYTIKIYIHIFKTSLNGITLLMELQCSYKAPQANRIVPEIGCLFLSCSPVRSHRLSNTTIANALGPLSPTCPCQMQQQNVFAEDITYFFVLFWFCF